MKAIINLIWCILKSLLLLWSGLNVIILTVITIVPIMNYINDNLDTANIFIQYFPLWYLLAGAGMGAYLIYKGGSNFRNFIELILPKKKAHEEKTV